MLTHSPSANDVRAKRCVQSEGAISLAGDRPFCPNLSKIWYGIQITATRRPGFALQLQV